MSEIRSILLHLDASGVGAARLALVRGLADRHGARITALFGARPDEAPAAFAYSAGAALSAALAQAAPGDIERVRLRETVETAPGCTWREVVADTLVHGFVAESAYADLLVLGQPSGADADGSAPAGFVESVILQSGTPAIVIPHTSRPAAVGESVLVAWNGSPQAARALKAALPLLRLAAKVDVVSWARHAPAAPYSGIDLQGWLQRHDIDARMHLHPPVGHLAVDLGARAEQLGSDLVVMGCYGHSRIRQQVFGGVTRGVLARLPVPVLMAH